MPRKKVVEPTEEIIDPVVDDTEVTYKEPTPISTATVGESTTITDDTIFEKPLTISPIVELPNDIDEKEVVVDRFYISMLIEDTNDEIERCNDYIDSGNDSNQTFAVYKKELREYRYLLRQVQFQPGFPTYVMLPQKPVRPNDE